MAQFASLPAPSQGGIYKDKDHPDQIRQSNITAAKGLLNITISILK